MNLRSEKAIKKVLELNKTDDINVVAVNKKNDISLSFFNQLNEKVATFTLKSLIAKRYPKRKKT